MATLPGLVIKIGANTKDAIDGLNKVNNALGKSATRSDKFTASLRKAGPALAAAGAAAGVLAVAVGTQAVRAAMDEQAELAKLNTTLRNLGFSNASEQVNEFVDDLQFSTGVADSELRPAFDRLVRSTGSVGEAQRALSIALDTSVGTGRSLQAVAEALGKAYDGNTVGLSRLGAGLDKTILKTGDMNVITAALAQTFNGQAATAADTLQGRMAILRIGVDELNESFGQGIIDGFIASMGDGSDSLDGATAALRDNQATVEAWGNIIGQTIANVIGWFDDFALGAMKVNDLAADSFRLTMDSLVPLLGALPGLSSEELDAADAAREQAMRNYALKGSLDSAATASDATAGSQARLATAAESNTRSMDKQKSAADKLKASLDKLNGNRSIIRQRINLRRMLEEGPQGTGKDGKVTARDKRLFALDVADARAQLGEDIFNQGGKGSKAAARAQFRLGRADIAGMGFSDAFAQRILGTPGALRPVDAPAFATPQTGQQVASVNYNFYGGINVDSNAAIQQAAKEAKRLASLSGDRYAGMAATGKGYRR